MAFKKNSGSGIAQPQAGLPEGFDVNRPMRGSKDGYFFLWLDLNKQYGEIANSMDKENYDPRLYRKIRHMIATITDDSIRLYAWNLLDGTIHQIEKDTKLDTPQKKNKAIMDTCDIILGEIWSFYDQFVGVTHRLRLGNADAPPGSEDDYGDGVSESPVGVPEQTDVVIDI
jgi:hypothetical protein